MTDAQHDFVLFILIAIVAGAVLGAVVTLAGCGGAEFETQFAEKRDAATVTETAAPWQDEPVALETGDKPDAAIRDEFLVESSIVNIPEAAPVEADVNPDAFLCDLASCKNMCPRGSMQCCAGTRCGCTDFGPACI